MAGLGQQHCPLGGLDPLEKQPSLTGLVCGTNAPIQQLKEVIFRVVAGFSIGARKGGRGIGSHGMECEDEDQQVWGQSAQVQVRNSGSLGARRVR